MDYQIFISYRRDGGEDLAGRLSDRLRGMGYKVFYDVESMRSGVFNVQLLDAISAAKDFLLVLPPSGLDRCRDPEDWVRREIEHAIGCGKNIIPVMMRNFEFPPELPPKMEVIRNYEGVKASTDYFDAVISRIESLLESAPSGKNPLEDIKTAEQFIGAGLYPQAKAVLDKAMIDNPSESPVYYYLAICQLGGKRPFLLSKSVVDEALRLLEVAVMLESKGIYSYFMAYIKYDFHNQKHLIASPDYRQHLSNALRDGVNDGEINGLYRLLRLQRPSGM